LPDKAEIAAAVLGNAGGVAAAELADVGILQAAVERIGAEARRKQVAIGGIAGCDIEGDATAGVGRCRSFGSIIAAVSNLLYSQWTYPSCVYGNDRRDPLLYCGKYVVCRGR